MFLGVCIRINRRDLRPYYPEGESALLLQGSLFRRPHVLATRKLRDSVTGRLTLRSEVARATIRHDADALRRRTTPPRFPLIVALLTHGHLSE